MSYRDVRHHYEEPDDDWQEAEVELGPIVAGPCWWCGANTTLVPGGRFCSDGCDLAWCRWSRDQIDQLDEEEGQ